MTVAMATQHVCFSTTISYTIAMNGLSVHLRKVGTMTTYRKGDRLFFQGEQPQHALFILSGTVKASTTTPEGDENIVSLYSKGQILPLAWLTGHSSIALFHYEALNDIHAIRVSKELFHTTVYADTELLQEFLHLVSRSQADLLIRVAGLIQPQAIEKICYILYLLTLHYGIEQDDGSYKLDLKLTQGMLARFIGQTRESTAKNLKIIEETDIITHRKSTYLIYKDRMEQYLNEQSFHDMKPYRQ